MTVAMNDLARVFVFPRGVNGCNVRPVYGDCFSVDGLSQDGGDITAIECPDPFQYGKFVEVAATRGERGRLTTTMTRRMIMQEVAFLRSLFDNDCAIDLHLHWGQCTDPTQFNQYVAAWILQDVFATNWATDTTIAQSSGDRAPVNESIDISARNFFQVMASLRYSGRGGALIRAALVSIAVCGNRACAGDACPPSTGCDKIYVTHNQDVTNTNEVFLSLDGGDTWASSIGPVVTADAVGIACLGRNILLVFADGTIALQPRDTLDDTSSSSADDWTAYTEAVDGVPTAVIGLGTVNGAVVLVGTSTGQIFSIDESGIVTLLDDTAAATSPINGFASDGNTVLAFTASGLVLVSRGSGWSATLGTTGVTNLYAGVVKTVNHWLVAGADGIMLCTLNGGCTWTQVQVTGLTTGDDITDMCAANDHVIWMVADGKIWRSIDGGSTWVLEPNDSTPGCRTAVASLGTLTKLACCTYDPNFVVAIGEAVPVGEDPALGLIVVGEP